MFTGIVEETGIVIGAGGDALTVRASTVLEGTRLGDSIDVNGACLTVVSLGSDSFSVETMLETRRRTNLGRLRYGDAVNLERAMPGGGRFGGHLVQGHVDDTGRVASVTAEEGASIMMVSLPPALARYVVRKGFVAVDGASLTVVDCSEANFSVSLVRFTREKTTLGSKRPGDLVNLEVDIIAKYVERLFPGRSGDLTYETLEQYGYTKR